MGSTFSAGDNVVLKGHPNPMMTVEGYVGPSRVRCSWFLYNTGELKRDIFSEDALEIWTDDEE